MARAKPTLARTAEKLSNYKFDATKYKVLDVSVRRDRATGHLTSDATATAPKGKHSK
jgi:hypothetical protein